ARWGERGNLLRELFERPEIAAFRIGSATCCDGFGLYRGRAVTEAVANVGEHARELDVGIRIHRHHGRTVVDAIHLAFQAVQHDRDRRAFIAEHSRRTDERRSERTTLGTGRGCTATVAAVARETDRAVERPSCAIGLEAVRAEQAHEVRILHVRVVPELLVDRVHTGGSRRFGGRANGLLGVGYAG